MYVAKFVKAGHEVETAKSAAEAVSKLKDGYAPEIVLIDIVLPDMDGLDLLSKIKDEKLAPEAVFIMFTNQNGNQEISRAKSLNVAGYIIKANLIPSEVVAKVLDVAQNHKN